MKAGRDLNALAAELTRQAETKRDFTADTRKLELRYTQDSDDNIRNVTLEGINGGMRLRPAAHTQLAGAVGIPPGYYSRMLAEAPDLLAANVNRWFQQAPQKRLVRTLDGSVRAFLSDSYRPLDNYDLSEAVLPKLLGIGATVVSCEVTENRFYLKAVTDRVAGEVRRGDVVQAGVVVSNSEIGQGSLRVEALDYRLVCLNGMIRETSVRKAHLGRQGGRGHNAVEDAREFYRTETRKADDRAFWLKVQDAVSAMFDQRRFDARIEQYREAAERVIEANPVGVVETTARKYCLDGGERTGVMRHLLAGGDLSQWGLANAVTRAAADAGDYDRASELEKLGGEVIELPPSAWRALAGMAGNKATTRAAASADIFGEWEGASA